MLNNCSKHKHFSIIKQNSFNSININCRNYSINNQILQTLQLAGAPEMQYFNYARNLLHII